MKILLNGRKKSQKDCLMKEKQDTRPPEALPEIITIYQALVWRKVTVK